MRTLEYVNFCLTKLIFEELNKEHKWAKRIHNLNHKPVYIKLDLSLLYHTDYVSRSYDDYSISMPIPNGLDHLLSEEQVMLLIQSSSLIGLTELSYLAASLHEDNKQNKL